MIRKRILFGLAAMVLSISAYSTTGTDGSIQLNKGKFKIVFSDNEPDALKLAVKSFIEDIESVMKFSPMVIDQTSKSSLEPEIIIVNRATNKLNIPANELKKLDGFESHRIYTDSATNKIYLEGFDMRGTIYAIYTFSEKFLGIPPLKYYASWVPALKEQILIPKNCNIFFKSPQVRYRCLLTGDQDFIEPWVEKSESNNKIWLETALRLKLNSVEAYSTILPDYKLTEYAYLIHKYGLVLASHHTSGLNTSFRSWEQYWEQVRKMEAPKLLLSNEQAILDFFRYNAETVVKSGIENLWTIAFRGRGDQPFWTIFEDSPESMEERAEIINRMLQIQYDLIKEVTGEEHPYARVTFYDELATLMAKGYLKPPQGENMIWTFVAARRDPYPYNDLVNFNPKTPVKLGYYMNFGFASTGAHVVPGEGPWKMEFNYRYINNKSPLYFSVVNTGNLREFVTELSANAKMLWDYESYSTDNFLLEYCAQYFGKEHASEIASLYTEYYNAFWQQRKSEFEGMKRQFIFQDLRYARVFDHMFEAFYFSENEIDMNPLYKIGYEHVPGRTYRLDFAYNNSDNQVDAILNGMEKTIPKFKTIAEKCTKMMALLDEDKQTFFNDNLRIYSYYMYHLSEALYHFTFAYKNQRDEKILMENLERANKAVIDAKNILMEGQHGVFDTWYTDAEPMERTFQLDQLLTQIDLLKHGIDGKMYDFLRKPSNTIPLEPFNIK